LRDSEQRVLDLYLDAWEERGDLKRGFLDDERKA